MPGAEERNPVPPPPRHPSEDPRRTPARASGRAQASRGQGAAGQSSKPPRQDDQRSARPQRPARPTRADASQDGPRRPRLVEPALPADIDPRELDRGLKAGLRSLPKDLAEKIGVHLIAAGRLIDDDPEAAAAHTRYARGLAPRLAVVREAAGVAAYRTGDYATALSELRAVRRMTGDPTYLPIMADCERGLGRPERAIALAADPDVARLAPTERVEMAIVASGARRDRGEAKAAVVALQGPDLDRSEVAPWTVRLWYAYAAALLDAGRVDEAKQWFESVVTIDEDDETDAEERVAELEQA
jgi:tetratricopeptide (TPR) repeat protein